MSSEPVGSITVAEAYAHCERITRTEARNFSYGIRLLPPVKRRALSAVYAMARRIDDIGDGDLPSDDKVGMLADIRKALHNLDEDPADDTEPDPVLVALRDAAEVCQLPLSAFDELIDGCESDVRGHSYQTFEDLTDYCRCVAGSIGRLSLGVFGSSDPIEASRLANTLGIALQITNVLRDLTEDHVSSRVYLPIEDMETFGCRVTVGDGGWSAADPERVAALVRFEADRAEQLYDVGLRLLPMLDRRSAACTGAMAGIYHRLLGRIRADPAAVLRGRVRLSPWTKARVAAVALAGGRP